MTKRRAVRSRQTRSRRTTRATSEAPRVVILAAGLGSRMRSTLPTVLHRLGGLSLLESVLRTAESLAPSRIAVVLGPARSQVEPTLAGRNVTVVVEDPPRGTGDAARRALAALPDGAGPVLVLSGDLPLIRTETLAALLARLEDGLDLVFLSSRPPDPGEVGRVVRDRRGRVLRIAEGRAAAAGRQELEEVDAGVYGFAAGVLTRVLERLDGGGSAETSLAGAVEVLSGAGGRVESIEMADWREAWAIRTRGDLAAAEEIARRRALERALDSGATLIDPATTRIGPDVRIEPDVLVHPFVSLEGKTLLREGCEIRSFTRLADSEVAAGAVIGPHCDIEGATIGARSRVGPFARVRPETVLEEDVRVGNFVETKKALLRTGVKASHLSYLGDVEVGAQSNIGAGVITCNYDGERKHRTTIGAGAFVGSDSQLVAPVTVGEGAFVGAGSTITKDVPPGALAIARSRQENIEGWASRRAKKKAPAGHGGKESR